MISLTDEVRDFLALSLCPRFTPRRIGLLMDQYGTASEAIKAPIHHLQQLLGIKASALQEDFQPHLLQEFAEREIRQAEKNQVGLYFNLQDQDPDYPELLTQLADPPPVLYVKGRLLSKDINAFTIVGSRKISDAYFKHTKQVAGELAAEGLTIVSGGAVGADQAAHSAAIQAQGRTLVVLACGMNISYPKENQKLFEQVLENGALISEFPFGTRPSKFIFHRRNRLLAALSAGVLISYASESSGALITAKHALDLGKEIFAFPGAPFDPELQGNHELIRSGATLVCNAGEILQQLYPVLGSLNSQVKEEDQIENQSPLHPNPSGGNDPSSNWETHQQNSAHKAGILSTHSYDNEHFSNIPSQKNLPEKFSENSTHIPTKSFPEDKKSPFSADLDDISAKVLSFLHPNDKLHMDTLSARSGFSIGLVLTHLQKLELKGYCQRLPGGFFIRTG